MTLPADRASLWSGDHLERVTQCPYCGGALRDDGVSDVADWFFRTVPGRFAFAPCASCASLVLHPRLKPDYLPHAYASYYTHTEEGTGRDGAGGRKAGLAERIKAAYVRDRYCRTANLPERLGAFVYRRFGKRRTELDIAYRFLPPAPARVLDYGCGGGEFLGLASSLGYEVAGIDFDAKALDRAKRAGLAVFTPDQAPQDEWRDRFDAVTLGHVIEHVAEPRRLLEQLHGWMRPGGRLFIEVPHAQAEGLRIYGKYWRGLEAPRHLALPSAGGLAGLLADVGFVRPQRILRRSVRPWLWAESAAVADERDRPALADAQATAPPETLENSEFIDLLCFKA